MTKKEAAEIILAGRRAAGRVGRNFVVDREKLAAAGGFSKREIDEIEATADRIDNYIKQELLTL